MIKHSYKLFLFILLIYNINVKAQEATLDWKLHDIGALKQLVTNTGALWRAQSNYPGLIYCEYPLGSNEEHVGEGGIWIGSIVGNDTLVSVTTGWNSNFEFYPTAEFWDTIWVINKGDTVNIPYWPNYIGISDQDLVCRYSDYNITNIPTHKPLNVDVIQQSFAWSSPPINEQIVYNFYIVPKVNNLKNIYIAYWLDGNVGYRGEGWNFALDDYSVFYPEQKLGVSMDYPGEYDGNAYSPIGIRIFPPKNINPDSLRWTFNWYPGQGMGAPSARDAERYKEMSSGIILENQQDPIGSQFIISFGPINLNVNDTLVFQVAEILGDGIDGLLQNSEMIDWLIGQNFHVPSPPPPPPLRTETKMGQVILKWNTLPGDINPETYVDPYRADSVERPFEGYRVYKSTQSLSGPWTLLAEYDLVDGIGFDYGLEYEYIDQGLLNNIEYYYAVTSFSKEDTVTGFPSQESSLARSSKVVVPGPEPPPSVGEVAVVPNPYRGDVPYYSYNPPWEKPPAGRQWMEQDRKIQFINLPIECEIKIYTLSGDLVETLYHNDPNRGYENWNLTSNVGQAVSSGIYLFTVEDKISGKVQVGKFVIIK